MKIGVLDVLAYQCRNTREYVESMVLNKQYVSITNQAISVWCREMGHQAHYATYAGFGDPGRALPKDLDLLFIGTHTVTAPLAYALSRLHRRRGVRTVVGGPHAKSFPLDCLRYFDIAVIECDRELVAEIIADHVPPGSVVSSASPYGEPPLARDGVLPLNTNGGQLSGGRLHGYAFLHEAVVQLRCDGGPRQIAKSNPQVAIAAAGGGNTCGCMLLTRE